MRPNPRPYSSKPGGLPPTSRTQATGGCGPGDILRTGTRESRPIATPLYDDDSTGERREARNKAPDASHLCEFRGASAEERAGTPALLLQDVADLFQLGTGAQQIEALGGQVIGLQQGIGFA